MRSFSFVQENAADTTILLGESEFRGMRESDRVFVGSYGSGTSTVKTRLVEGGTGEKTHGNLTGDGFWIDGNFAEIEIVITGTVDLRVVGFEG